MLSSFFPVVAGRVSDALSRGRTAFQIQSDQASLAKLETQLSTGFRFQTPSEDPTAALKVMGLQKSEEFKQQSIVNLKSSQGYLNITETALSGTQDVLNSVKSIAVEGATNTLGPSERDSLVAQLDEYLSRLATVGNQKSQDRYLFAGGDVNQQPIELKNASVRFKGDDTSLLTIADQNDYVAHNITGQRALGLVSDGVVGTADLDPSIDRNTRLADLTNGRGIYQGAIQLSDGTDKLTVDLATSETLGDVVDRLSNAKLGGRSIAASLTATGLQLNYADGSPGTLRISNVGSGTTASELGIATTAPAPTLPIVGNDLDPIVRTTTLLSQLNGGTGLSVTGGIKITQGSSSYNIQLDGATTVEELLGKINTSGAGVQADIAPGGRSIRIRSIESGTDFSISEGTGTLASRLGIKTFTGSTRLDALSYSQGLSLADGADLTFTRSNGTEFNVDLQSAVTVQDAIDLINNSPDNADPALKITASLNPTANGLVLKATVPIIPTPAPVPPPTVAPIRVRSANGSGATTRLGLGPTGATEAVSTVSGTEYVLNGTDPNPQEVKGVFNSVIRLRAAIRSGDVAEIGRASSLVDQDIDRVSLTRGDVGIRQQRIDFLQASAEDNITELKSQESDNHDVDVAKLIVDINARQTAYQANLKLLGQTTKLSIFDFL